MYIVENFVGRGEKAGYQHVFLFPLCFQKLYLSLSLKVWIMCEGVYHHFLLLHCFQKLALSGNVNPFPNKPWLFTGLLYKTLENTMGKNEIAHNEQFLLFQ